MRPASASPAFRLLVAAVASAAGFLALATRELPAQTLDGQIFEGQILEAPSQPTLHELLRQQPGDELPAVHADRLEVKLAEGCGAEWRGSALISRAGVDLTAVAQCFADATVEPMVTGVSREQLDEWHRHACAVLPEHNRPGHLGLWFRLRCPDAAAAEQLRERLFGLELVEHVYREPRYYPASVGAALAPPPIANGGDLPPTTPAFMSMQQSHGPAPVGHGLRRGAGILGGRGRGIGLRMIETSWVLDHEDVCKLTATNFLGPVPQGTMSASFHGLSGTAIVLADRNDYGITGVADELDPRFLSVDLNGGFPNAVALALANSQPGDIMLVIEMVLVPSLGPGTWLPIEFIQSTFDATLTATANGLMVVVPAGNGNRSLDDPALLGRFDRNFRDSGAIMVAASDGGAFVRAPFSNWGSRVDAHSWGDNVISCGYGTLFYPNNDVRQSYTASATGTSSAAPHLAGIVAGIQGAARRQLGQALSNETMLDLLHTYGATTPDIIGRRPDMVAILESLGVFDGLALVEPDVSLGGTIAVDMDGPPVSVVGLFGSFGTGDVPLGFNRNVHLDLVSLSSLGAFVITGGPVQYQLPVPNNASLQGADIYFQAARLTGAQPLFLTNSCHVTIL